MKKSVKLIMTATALLALTGCGTPTESSSSIESSSSESSSTSAANVVTSIAATDNIGSYTVGEVLDSIFDINVSLTYTNGTVKDVTAKPAYYKYLVKDSSGATIDTSKPFETAGTYTMQVYYRTDNSVITEPMSFTVSNKVTTAVTTKTDATSAFTYSDVENSSLSNLSYPNSGDIKTLVIPMEITDYPFASGHYGANYRTALDNIFNGDGADDTGYWESVSSYYKKSSLGKMNFDFEIAETYQCGKSTTDLNEMNSGKGTSAYVYTTYDMVEACIANYKATHGDASTKQFDNDGDGYIDGLWIVYSAPDYSSNSTIGALANKNLFWAYCTDTDANEPNIESPTLHSFGWASSSFMDEGVVAPAVDAHTFIHETGHLQSLTDYYSYDISSASTSGCQGGLAMMDLNIGDQDAFSKVGLGWSDPYVVTEDCTVTINPNESSADCVLLADNWNGTAFDEYMLFDLQTGTGLNELDSTKAYASRPLYFNEAGVRAYHVDARIGELMYLGPDDGLSGVTSVSTYWVSDEGADDYYLTDSDVEKLVEAGSLPRMEKDLSIDVDSRKPGYSVINGNCASRAGLSKSPYSDNRLLTLVGADNKNCETDLQFGSNKSLFRKGESWSLTRRGAKYFTTVPGKFNNGNDLNWVVTVLECSETSATLQFRKYSK